MIEDIILTEQEKLYWEKSLIQNLFLKKAVTAHAIVIAVNGILLICH